MAALMGLTVLFNEIEAAAPVLDAKLGILKDLVLNFLLRFDTLNRGVGSLFHYHFTF